MLYFISFVSSLLFVTFVLIQFTNCCFYAQFNSTCACKFTIYECYFHTFTQPECHTDIITKLFHCKKAGAQAPCHSLHIALGHPYETDDWWPLYKFHTHIYLLIYLSIFIYPWLLISLVSGINGKQNNSEERESPWKIPQFTLILSDSIDPLVWFGNK